MGIVADDIARVRQQSDIVAIASEHLALRRVGRRWVGLCPFHAEKTPSFSINQEEGLWYCLAGETGVITWNGVRPIAELAGTTQRILTERGRWVVAPFHSFGTQRLWRIELGRNGQRKIIHATAEHRWLVERVGRHRVERITRVLRPGAVLASSFARDEALVASRHGNPAELRGRGDENGGDRRAWIVKSVEPTERVEEVYCAVVDGTHNFALEDNILTGNCFGCQAKGDVITFVREVEHLDFVQAVEKLASRAGVELHYDDDDTAGRDRRHKAALYEAMEKAVEWYHDRLLKASDAGPARGYLRSRGYDRDVVERYRLGWAPTDWDALARALRLPDDVFEGSGLGYRNRAGRQTDAFRGRVLFPIFDVQGRPVAFGGRAIGATDGPKYKNSPETPLYSKSRTLYGLNWAKRDIVQLGEVVVCEGYTDVIGFALAGVPRAVATCGTALADEHFRTLKNFARRVVLAYDADAAGQAAAERFYEWERRYEVDIAVAGLPPGKDPADVARDSPEALRDAVQHAKAFLAFRVDRVLLGADLSTPESRVRAAERALSVIGEHPNDLTREQYLMHVADYCRLEVDRLRSRLHRRGERPVPASSAPRPVLEREGPELEALRVAIVRRDEIIPLLAPVLFADDRHLAAFVALASASNVHEAIDRADPETAALLQRLAVEDTEAEPVDVVARLTEERARAVVAELQADARTSDDPAAYAPIVGWLKLRTEELREPSTALDAVAQLVAWLSERIEEQQQV